MEARERLLTDMEDKARERAELAEQEAYRLKGILSHMEHVVNNMRGQNSDEKDRLKQEHSRLAAAHKSLEADKLALQSRNAEELSAIKQRSKELEIEMSILNQVRALLA